MTAATYARAAAGYDDRHEAELFDAITGAIFEASLLSDVNCVAIRTAETAWALLTATLACTLAVSPHVSRSPTSIRKTMDELHKGLRRRIASAENDPDLQDFVRRMFRGTDIGSHA